MPNWCHNRVSFSGTPEDIENLVATLTGETTRFDFNKVIPMPEELSGIASPVTAFKTNAEVDAYNAKRPQGDGLFIIGKAITHAKHKALLKKYAHADWYNWSIENWGCKWNNGDDIAIEDEEEGYIRYSFETPWGPPEGIYHKLVAEFPEVQITWFYDEPGMQFSGYLPN